MKVDKIYTLPNTECLTVTMIKTVDPGPDYGCISVSVVHLYDSMLECDFRKYLTEL